MDSSGIDDISLDIQEMNYNTLLFRHIDRVQSILLTNVGKEEKVFFYYMGVMGLVAMIPSKLRDDTFKESLEELNKARKELREGKDYALYKDFENIQATFELCINQLQRQSFFFRRVATGVPIDN